MCLYSQNLQKGVADGKGNEARATLHLKLHKIVGQIFKNTDFMAKSNSVMIFLQLVLPILKINLHDLKGLRNTLN